MSGIFSVFFFLLGIVWAIAGKEVIVVLACFLICAVFDGAFQIQELRKDLEDMDDE